VQLPRPNRSTIALGTGGALAVAAGGALLQRRHLASIAADPLNERLSAPPHGRPLRVRSPDGTTLHIEIFGEDGAPPIILAHGWTEQLSYWTLVVPRLVERGFRVAAYDLRGHGQSSEAASGDYSVARFGDDLEAVIGVVCADGERPLVAGHSLGAMSIVAWAEHHQVSARVRAAALLNTGVGALIAESLIVPVPWLAQALNRTPLSKGVLSARGGVPKFSTPISSAMVHYTAFGPTATPALVAFYERMLVACPPDVRAGVGLALTEMDLNHAVPQLTVPTLVMAGANDRLTPPVHAERIAAALPDLHRLIVLPQTGHMGPLERPAEVAEALLALAERTAAPAGAAVVV
jgi:pimeloyl-ACP methyl ester carboxylesterase